MTSCYECMGCMHGNLQIMWMWSRRAITKYCSSSQLFRRIQVYLSYNLASFPAPRPCVLAGLSLTYLTSRLYWHIWTCRHDNLLHSTVSSGKAIKNNPAISPRMQLQVSQGYLYKPCRYKNERRIIDY